MLANQTRLGNCLDRTRMLLVWRDLQASPDKRESNPVLSTTGCEYNSGAASDTLAVHSTDLICALPPRSLVSKPCSETPPPNA